MDPGFCAYDQLIALGQRPPYSLDSFADGVDSVFERFDAEARADASRWEDRIVSIWSRVSGLERSLRSLLVKHYQKSLSVLTLAEAEKTEPEEVSARINVALHCINEDLLGVKESCDG